MMKKINVIMLLMGLSISCVACGNENKETKDDNFESINSTANIKETEELDNSAAKLRIDEQEIVLEEEIEDESNKELSFEEEVSRLEDEVGVYTSIPNEYEDLNNDGVPEVIIYTTEADLNYDVYTLYNGEWKYVISSEGGGYGGVSDIDNSPYFEYMADSSYSCFVSTYTIDKGELVKKAYIGVSNLQEYLYPSEEIGYDDEIEYEYEVCGQDVTVDEYWNYIDSILPSEEVSLIKACMSF